MKLYLAGPMTGIPDYNFPAFNAAAAQLREAGHTVINPAELDDPLNTNLPWDYYLRRDLKLLVDCEGVRVLPGWQRSKGARLEIHVAASLGIPCRDFEFPDREIHPLNPWQADVTDFHAELGHTIGTSPAIGDPELRAKLLIEETAETIAALGISIEWSLWTDENQPRNEPADWGYREATPDLADAIDGICDVIYVAAGAAVTMGVNLTPYWNEVQRSNMAKAGGPVRADGKRLKPAGWTPPDIAGILARETAA